MRSPAASLLELHEHQVPDFDEAVAVGLGRARRTAGNVRPVVVEYLGAWSARAEIPHLPEIVGAGDADDPALRQPRNLPPQAEGFVVVDEHGHQQAIRRKPEFLGDQIPGKLDGAILEIVPEREVPEHLEERVMAGGVADIVEVVVLAARPNAFLRGDRTQIGSLLEAGEDILELHHAGIGEHQGRIVPRHERRGRHDLVAVAGKIVQEARPDLVDATHGQTTSDAG